MVTIALNIKNGSKAFKPKPGDVIIFDGKDWYITKKEDIFREYDEKMLKMEQKVEKMEEFKAEVNEKIDKMSDIMQKFVILQNEGD